MDYFMKLELQKQIREQIEDKNLRDILLKIVEELDEVADWAKHHIHED